VLRGKPCSGKIFPFFPFSLFFGIVPFLCRPEPRSGSHQEGGMCGAPRAFTFGEETKQKESQQLVA